MLILPDMKGRYFLFPMLDGWTNVFQVPGKRTTGTGAQTYAITGPGWTGTLPAGVKRVQVADEHGLDPWAHLLHRHGGRLCRRACAAGPVRLVPLSAYGKAAIRRPTARSIRRIDMKTPCASR